MTNQTYASKEGEENLRVPEEYMGNDNRSISEIVATDLEELKRMDVSRAALAEKMEKIRDMAVSKLEEEIEIAPALIARADMARGVIHCPLCGETVGKTNILLTNKKSGESIVFSDMNIHLIEVHGFFEGKGSGFRLEPSALVDMLFND
jgi:predicted transcriptional regulator